ncbi:MAG: glycosyltransferase family 39 protein [Planctomycetota bacterium]
MKSSDKIESDKPDVQKTSGGGRWCWLAMLLIIICAAVIRGRLASMPLERDEGEYAYIGQEMLRGVWPYESAYSMKLPGIYAIYAVILAIFGQTQTAIHTGLIIFNAATILVIFLIAKELFGWLAAVAASAAYAIMSLGTPVLGLSANAEHFVVLPALIGVLLIAKSVERRKLPVILAAGLLFGLAFIIKQHGVFFGVFGSLYLLYADLRHRPIQWKKTVVTQFVFAVGAVAPFALTCVLFWKAGLFDKFWFWTFTYASKYAARIPLSVAWDMFMNGFAPVVKSAKLIWIFVPVGLICVVLVKQYRRWAVLVVGLLIFSFFAVCPGFYFRGHYFIFLLPAAAILAGVGFVSIGEIVFSKFRKLDRTIIISAIGLAIAGYSLYQQRIFLFDNTPEVVCRLIYGFNPFPESLPIADFIRANTEPNDTVAVIGSEPQIYFYSGRRAATAYIYTYPLMEPHDYAAEMQQEMIKQIESARPEFLVFVRVSYSWLAGPGSVELIFQWFNSYQSQYYDVVGVADMVSSEYTVWRWNEQAINYTPSSESWVAIFRRKP